MAHCGLNAWTEPQEKGLNLVIRLVTTCDRDVSWRKRSLLVFEVLATEAFYKLICLKIAQETT